MSTLTEALAPRSDQLNADDLIPGPRTIKITGAKVAKDGRQLRVTLNFEGDNGKPFKPCKTMGRAMVMVWGITDENYEEQFVGKSIRVYRDPDVKFGDQGAVGGIRISHMSHIDKPAHVKLTVSQGQKREFVFQPLPKAVDDRPQEDGARKWANGYIAKVKAAEDRVALEQHAEQRAAKLDELKTKRPELYQSCIEALEARRQEFAPEGRADSDFGEQFATDDDADDTGF